MKLSENFSLQELTKSETALRFGMKNDPSEADIQNLKMLCEKVLQPIRDHFKMGVKVNSGFRHPEVNAKVGGSKTSDHCKGQAADIEIPSIANADLANWISDNLSYTQLILEFYTPGIPDSGWVHVSYDPKNLKKQNLTATSKNGKTVYQNGLIAQGIIMKWVVLFLIAGVATAASLDDNGNLLLSKEEVNNTRALYNELNRIIQYQQYRIEQLEKAVEDVETRKCL